MPSWQIKKISLQKKNSSRATIDFDGFILGISLLLVGKYQLREGDLLSEEKLAQIWKEEVLGRARNKALSLIALRPRAEKEIRERLKRYLKKSNLLSAALPVSLQIAFGRVIDKTVIGLKKKKLIDDKEFCRWWIEQRSVFRPRSMLEIKSELFRKGVKREIIEGVLQETGYSEKKMIERLIEKKIGRWGKMSKGERRKKLTLYLTRKGFSYKTVISVIDEKPFFK